MPSVDASDGRSSVATARVVKLPPHRRLFGIAGDARVTSQRLLRGGVTAKRAAIALATALAIISPAALADPLSEKQAVDARIGELRERITDAQARESVLTSDLAAASEQITLVQGQVDVLAGDVARLERELERQEARLAELRTLLERQTRTLDVLGRNQRVAEERLAARVVEIYTVGRPGTLEVLLSVSSLDELITQLQYADEIAERDQELALSVAKARREMAVERQRTAQVEREEAEATAALAARTAEQRDKLGELVARRDELARATSDKQALLSGVQAERSASEEDLEVLEQASEQLAERIRSSQTTAPAQVEGSGALLWPVSGAVTSSFGTRWGRLHAGLDIGVGFGTPIRAAGGGTVIYAGWMGGYGNLVVLDHGGGLTTAYAHQQRVYISSGQRVSRGDPIGEVGSTGNSTGPHLHFETRVNGNPVDPFGYL